MKKKSGLESEENMLLLLVHGHGYDRQVLMCLMCLMCHTMSKPVCLSFSKDSRVKKMKNRQVGEEKNRPGV